MLKQCVNIFLIPHIWVWILVEYIIGVFRVCPVVSPSLSRILPQGGIQEDPDQMLNYLNSNSIQLRLM